MENITNNTYFFSQLYEILNFEIQQYNSKRLQEILNFRLSQYPNHILLQNFINQNENLKKTIEINFLNSYNFNLLETEKKFKKMDIDLNLKSQNSNNSLITEISNIEKKEIKSFICAFEGCGKIFDYKWILDRHINSHFCFKLYKCNFPNCNKSYKSKENLNLHVKNKHHGIKPYCCKYCNNRFSHRNGIISLCF